MKHANKNNYHKLVSKPRMDFPKFQNNFYYKSVKQKPKFEIGDSVILVSNLKNVINNGKILKISYENSGKLKYLVQFGNNHSYNYYSYYYKDYELYFYEFQLRANPITRIVLFEKTMKPKDYII